MRAPSATLTPVCLVLVSLAGCDWREFDEALSKAPVLSVGAAGGDYKARDVGKVVLPLTVPAAKKDKVAARFLVAGTETPSLAVVDLDANGQPRTHVATGMEIMDMAGDAKASAKSAVELEDGRVLLGTPSYNLNPMNVPNGRIYLLKLEDKEDDLTFTLLRGADPGGRISYGLGVAAGKVGGAATQDFVVASQTDVSLVLDGTETMTMPNKPTCPVNLDDTAQEKYRFRAVGVGDLIEGGGEEIAVGVPREMPTVPGRVVILVPGEGGLDCPITITAPMNQPRFGTSLVVTDVNGDGKKDLLVGAPGSSSRAYLYPGPFTAGSAPAPREFKHPSLMDAQSLGDFGFRVGVVDIDGMPGAEVLVSAPDLPAHGEAGAGQVFAYKPDGTALMEISDNSPSSNANFGFSINGIRFSPGACGSDRPVLLVGADREVFTFFRVPGGPGDPRCFK